MPCLPGGQVDKSNNDGRYIFFLHLPEVTQVLVSPDDVSLVTIVDKLKAVVRQVGGDELHIRVDGHVTVAGKTGEVHIHIGQGLMKLVLLQSARKCLIKIYFLLGLT